MTTPPLILLIEDEPEIAHMIGRLLRMIGAATVLYAPHAQAALDMLAAQTPVLAVLDYNLPGGMNGLDVAQVLRERIPAIRLIMISAYATPELERQARLAGFDAFLTKPFDLDVLEATVQRLLRLAETP